MFNNTDIRFFRRELLGWFELNKRDFPWRKEGISNYELIMCEILLQRTRAETVAKYHDTFFRNYPGWEKLGEATLADLEQILKPLGLYKHRANRLYKISLEYKNKGGELPKSRNELNDSNLSALYISNAYELFILMKRRPLLDVNMARVLGRFFMPGIIKDVRGHKPMQQLSRRVINVHKCKELNWAILDFASSICRSLNPRCHNCVLSSKCRHNENLIKIEAGTKNLLPENLR